MSSEVCEAINEIEKIIVFNSETQDYTFEDEILNAFCPNQNCDTDGKKLGSGFISFLNYSKSGDDDVSENEKVAQYAFLWLNYKIMQNKNIPFGIKAVYDLIIENNEWFTEHRGSIKKTKDMMEIFVTYLNNLYTLLKEICNTITMCNEDSSDTDKCQRYAKKCVQLYQEYIQTGPKHHECCSPYCSILSNLKNDYEKFRKNNNGKKLPEFTLPNGVKSCESLCKSKEKESMIEKPGTEVSKIVTPSENSLPDHSSTELNGSQEEPLPKIEVQRNGSSSITLTSVTPPSINNGNKIPYIVSPFILILILLGISYKYLTLRWRKKTTRKKNMKKVINMCDKNKTQKRITNPFTENSQ
ncbi:CIR protein [Plasmodium chabaudi adami]|uniref:CIR protein n=1 Tax=Plasmodium chabaudi adami TaxID=5826 RepID=A0A1C6WP44_PLACE|nr:CIR protein [Plasmodium chabaudi adami]